MTPAKTNTIPETVKTHAFKKNNSFFQPVPGFNPSYDSDSSAEQNTNEATEPVLRPGADLSRNNLFFKPGIISIQRKCAHCDEEKVMRKANSLTGVPANNGSFFTPSALPVQRKCDACEKDEKNAEGKRDYASAVTEQPSPENKTIHLPPLGGTRKNAAVSKTSPVTKEEKERQAFGFMKNEVAEGTANGKVEAKHEPGKPVMLLPKKDAPKEAPGLKGKKSNPVQPKQMPHAPAPASKKNLPRDNEKKDAEPEQEPMETAGPEKIKTAPRIAMAPPMPLPLFEPVDKDLPAEVQQFLQSFYGLKREAVSKRNRIAERASQQKLGISEKVNTEKETLATLKDAKEKEIAAALKQSLASVNGQFNARKKAINADATANTAKTDAANEKNIADINKAASDNLSKLKADIEQRKKSFNDYVADQKAQPAIIATKEADRADAELDKAAAEAIKVGDQVASRFNDEDTGSDQKTASREVAKESAKEITDKKPGIREECMNKAREFKGNYDEYTGDVMTQLDNAQTGLSDEIEKSKAKTLEDNTSAFNKTKSDIEKGRVATENILVQAHKQIVASLQTAAAAARSTIKKESRQAFENFDKAAQLLHETIDDEIVNGLAAVDGLIGNSPDVAIQKLHAFDISIDKYDSAATEGLSGITHATSEAFDAAAKLFGEQSGKNVQGFSSSSGKMHTQHKKSADDLSQKFVTSSAAAITNMVAGQADMIKNAFTEIDKQIAERKGKIAKVNERFATDLKPAVDESLTEAKKPLTDPLWSRCFEAGEKAGESWWEGVLDAIGSLIKGLLIVVALAALLVLIVAALGGSLGFMAAMLIVGIVMLSIAAVASYIRRRDQGFGVAASLGLAVTDALGLTGIWEAASGKEVGTGKHLSTYERSKRGTEGVLSVILLVAGIRGSKGGAAAEVAAEGAEAGSRGSLLSGISKFLPEGLKTKFASLGEAAEFLKGKGSLIEKGLQTAGGKLGKALGTDKAIPKLNESGFGKAMGEKFNWWPKTTRPGTGEVKPPLEEIKPAEKTTPGEEGKTAEQRKPAEETKSKAEEKQPDTQEKKPDTQEKKPDVEEKKADIEERQPEVEEKKAGAEEKKPDTEETKSEVEEKKPAAEEQKPDIKDEKPGVEETKPEAEEKQPDVEDKKPGGENKPEEIDQLSDKGKNSPPLKPKEFHKVLKWQEFRNKFLSKWRNKDFSSFDAALKSKLSKARNSIEGNLTPDDLAATIKEQRGEKIFDEHGEPYDHIAENKGAQNSVRNAIIELKEKMLKDPANQAAYESLLRDLSSLLDEVNATIRN